MSLPEGRLDVRLAMLRSQVYHGPGRRYELLVTRMTLRPAHRSVDVLGTLSCLIPLAHLSIDARPALLPLPILVQSVGTIPGIWKSEAYHRGPPLDWLALRLVHLYIYI